jgi:hypothetical protein
VILFKVSLSLGIEAASSTTRVGANFLSPAVRIGATGLPTELERHDCKMQREQTFAGAKGLCPCLAPLVLPIV